MKPEGIYRWELWSALTPRPEINIRNAGKVSPPGEWITKFVGRVEKIVGYRERLSFGMFKNGITDAAINSGIDSFFNNNAPPAAWYMGLIDSTGFTALSAADTMASHAGWTENTDYAEATRPEWTGGSAASGVITNASQVVFTASSDITIAGLFIVSVNTKGDNTGILWSTGTFGVEKFIGSGQTLKLYYELRQRQG